jgi:hypothetical protein
MASSNERQTSTLLKSAFSFASQVSLLIVLDIITLSLFGKGLRPFGIEDHVTRPIMTAFILYGSLVNDVVLEKNLRSFGRRQGIVPTRQKKTEQVDIRHSSIYLLLEIILISYRLFTLEAYSSIRIVHCYYHIQFN